eukprot:GGOE01037518.1.p1 GENE.GGOE01037518.1~~GGOE01037518.1.p1  ORF type:complete len:445 (+),score=77.52 GGOE01037518.1:46-1335(+)
MRGLALVLLATLAIVMLVTQILHHKRLVLYKAPSLLVLKGLSPTERLPNFTNSQSHLGLVNHQPNAVQSLKLRQEVNTGFEEWMSAVNAGLSTNDMHQFGHNCSTQSRCDVVICTAIYLEEPYLEEWIHYQLLIGIDHIFFALLLTLHYAARRSAHFTERILKPYIARGQVSLLQQMTKWDVPRVFDQIDAIAHCFELVRGLTDWVLTTDVDEFYFSRTFPSYKHLVQHAEVLKVDALPIPWYMFGSSGHEQRPSGLTGDAYWRRSAVLVYDSETSRWFGRRNGKVIFRVTCLKEFKENTHRVILRDGCSVKPFDWNATEYHLKHYQLKSFEDFVWKRRGNGFTGVRGLYGGRGWWNNINRNFRAEWIAQDHLFNDTEDFDLRLYSSVLRGVLPPPAHAWWLNSSKWFQLSWVGPREPGHGKGPPIGQE